MCTMRCQKTFTGRFKRATWSISQGPEHETNHDLYILLFVTTGKALATWLVLRPSLSHCPDGPTNASPNPDAPVTTSTAMSVERRIAALARNHLAVESVPIPKLPEVGQ